MAKKSDQARAGPSGPVASEARPGDLWSGARQRLGWELGQIGRHDRERWHGPHRQSESQQAGEEEAIRGATAGISSRGSKQGPPISTQGLSASLMGRTTSERAWTEDVEGGRGCQPRVLTSMSLTWNFKVPPE